jgi:hypothetical protein
MKNSQDDALIAVETLSEFVKQFGEIDIYKRIIIEELLKELLKIKEENGK